MTSFMKEFEHLKIQLEEIKEATNSYDKSRVIGGGGFGAVYKGEVSHSLGRSTVAIKRLNRQFGQGDREFLKEIMMLCRHTHPNLVSLLGYCDEEKEKVLVYEFASKGSLDKHLSDPGLTWLERIKICLGAAKGLCYLHDPKGGHERVIHCDIKSANILLDESLTAKVADFGLSKMGPANQQYSLLVTNAQGTAGYCDPLFLNTYTLTKESDVYSFGVVLFEVICGTLCYEYSNGQVNKVLVNTWRKKYSEDKLDEIVFLDLKPQMDQTSLKFFSDVAFKCLHNSREDRPAMSIVVEELEKALQSQTEYELRQNLPDGYMEILDNAFPPVSFRSIDHLYELLSNGIFLHAGKTWFSRNEHGKHYVMISTAECVIPFFRSNWGYSFCYDSRFKVGCYSTNREAFTIHVKTQFLSPSITYRVNLVFNLKEKYEHNYISLKYTLNGEKKVSTVHVADKRQDNWLNASLHQFTSQERTVNLEIFFQSHYHYLMIEGIEFQPLEQVEMEVYQALELTHGEILKAMSHPLFTFRSEVELNTLLAKGVLLNEGNTWLSRNEQGEHYVMMSLAECLIDPKSWRFSFCHDSRFEVGCYSTFDAEFKTRVKTQVLSPLITYRVNLVFKLGKRYRHKYLSLKYTLNGEKKVSIVHLANKKENEWLKASLYQLITSHEKSVDLEISFDGYDHCGDLKIEGIEFQPLERVEVELHQALELTHGEILKAMAHPLTYRSEVELNALLAKGVLINEGNTWFSRNERGEHYVMISIAECLIPFGSNSWQYSVGYDTRFEVGCYATHCEEFKTRVKTQFLSPLIAYRVNLVFKLEKKYPYKLDFLSLKYILNGEKKVSMVHFANNREDEWLKASLYQFTSHGKTVDLEISFGSHDHCSDLKIEGIEFQPLEQAEMELRQVLNSNYGEILKVAAYPLIFKSEAELNVLLSKGILLNDGNTWFSRNDHGEHYVMMSLAECLIHPTGNDTSRYSAHNDSRFRVGCYSTKDNGFKIRVKTQFLSPLITYRMNLVFQFAKGHWRYNYKCVPLGYVINGEKRVSTVHFADKRDDEWLRAGLYQFTSHERTVDLEIDYDSDYEKHGLVIEGIELHPLEKVQVELHQVLDSKYGQILSAASHTLTFRSEAELNALLLRGVFFNGGKTWFSRNDEGVHYVFKSIEECLILEPGKSHRYYWPGYDSRFLVGADKLSNCGFKACVKTEFLSPLTTYAVNLVFKFENKDTVFAEQGLIWLSYKLDGETYSHISHLGHKREDDWWRVELRHFISDGTIVDLEIIFEGSLDSVVVDGIEFQPLEKEELQMLEDGQNNIDITLSDSKDDTYWENKLPTDYKDIIKFSEQGLQWTTNKELYSILYKGLLINYKPPFSVFQRPTNHGLQWYFLDKNGKTCLMLPIRTVCTLENPDETGGMVLHDWMSLLEAREELGQHGLVLTVMDDGCRDPIGLKYL